MAIKASSTITLSCVVDVWSTTRYYLLQSSTLARPAKPTTNPPGGSWSDTEPGYTAGSTNTLYFTDLTVFSDQTWAYSMVSVSSAYEAAKAAYNKAQAAQSAADQALSSTECIVGTQTASTSAWTGNASFSSLADGQTILYWLPYAGTSTAATLNLTLSGGGTTGAKAVYINATTRCTTHIAAGNMVQLVYRENVSIGGTAYTGHLTANLGKLEFDGTESASTFAIQDAAFSFVFPSENVGNSGEDPFASPSDDDGDADDGYNPFDEVIPTPAPTQQTYKV